MRQRFFALAAITWCLAALPASHAASPALDAVTANDPPRLRFLAAESAQANGDSARFRALRATLEAYPLTPYLDQAALREGLATAGRAEVDGFLDVHQGTPYAAALRADWLGLLAERGAWAAYAESYRGGANARLRCLQARALIETGRHGEAFELARSLWLVGQSQDDACDPAFATWNEAGLRTSALVWQRTVLAARAGNTRLMRYLERLLPSASARACRSWRSVLDEPGAAEGTLAAATALDAPRQELSEVLVHGIERVARRSPERAEHLFRRLQRRFDFSDRMRARVSRAIALNHAYSGNLGALPLFELHAGLTYAAASGASVEPDRSLVLKAIDWHAVVLLSKQRWQALARLLERIPPDHAATPRWRYWRARALAALGEQAQAERIYRTLASERGYYSFLAADRIGAAYAIDSVAFEPTKAEAAAFEALAGVRRARELYELDRLTAARREWRELTRDLDDRQLAVAAKTAQAWGWTSNAVLTGARSRAIRDDLDVRFPVAYRSEIERAALAQGIDTAWAFALTRQESAFMHDVRSGAGAVGLMQIMPATGRQIARRAKQRWGGTSSLLDPGLNTRYGTMYLRWMADRFGGRELLATAAYNAGPGRVERWLPDTGEMDADAWVETITFNETRGYVRRVMSYMAIYETHLGMKPSRLRSRMNVVRAR